MSTSTPECGRVYQVPGPRGQPGTNGADGTDGRDPISQTTASFVTPAVGDNVTISVDTNFWMISTAPVYIQNAGVYQIQSKPTATSVIVKNLGYTSPDGDNAPPGTPIPSSSYISPSGWRGPSGSLTGPASGSLAGSYPGPLIAPEAIGSAEINASIKDGAASLASLRTLGTSAQQACAGNDSRLSDSRPPTGAAGGDLGGSYPGPSLGITGVSAGTYGSATLVPALTIDAKGRVTNATGVAIAALLRQGLLGSLMAADLNQAVGPYDLAVSLVSSRQIIRSVVLENASTNLTTAQVGVYSGSGATGAIIAGVQTIAGLTGSGKWIDLALASGATDNVVAANTIYFRVGTAQGAPATVNVWIFGEKLD